MFRLSWNDGSCQLRLLSKDDVHAVSLSDRQNNGIVYTDWETQLGRGNHNSVLTTLNFSWQLNTREEMSERQTQILSCKEADKSGAERDVYRSSG